MPVFRILFLLILTLGAMPSYASSDLKAVIQANFEFIKKGSVKTAPPVIEAIQGVGGEKADAFLSSWQTKSLWYRKEDEQIFTVSTTDKKTYDLIDVISGDVAGTVPKNEIKQIKPNSGLRALLGAALVASQLTSDDVNVRRSSIDSLSRDPKPSHLQPLRDAIAGETDAALKASMSRLERLLTMQFDPDDAARIAAIRGFEDDLSVEVRARINQLLASRVKVAEVAPEASPRFEILRPGDDLTREAAYGMLVDAGLALADIPPEAQRKTLTENIVDGKVGGIEVAALGDTAMRATAYAALVAKGAAAPDPTDAEIAGALETAHFYKEYNEASPEVINAALETLEAIETKVGYSQGLDLFLDGLSLASIFFLAAVGLAITFGVMGVINMAHGEFIMLGAYSGYVVQQFITNYTVSIIVAIPVAFAVTFAAGVAMERLMIRHLYHRPLETLLATFGVSIALQQLAKNIFGTQARPLTSPDWLGGAWIINDVVQISWIRVAIFVLALIFFAGLWLTLNKTRLGLETRAVTQNPRMAASMGINPDKINMLTFGLGSGIAGIAGVAIGLYAKVTSELGADYIVQSFMTVVVGGVGNIWGTLAGATMIGFLQKGIEWFNPSNTLAAQTFMIIFIIIFIQFRPRGIIALKGRAAGD